MNKRLMPWANTHLKVSTKVYLAFAAVVALSLAALTAVSIAIKIIDDQLDSIVNTHAPLRAAAFELEINTVGTGMGVMKYLEKPDPKHRQRVADDNSDFQQFVSEYDRLALSEEARRLGREIGDRYRSFIALGVELMNRQDHLESLLAAFGGNIRRADDLLERQIEASNESPNLVKFEARLAEVGQWMALYLHTRDEDYLKRIDQDARMLRHLLDNGPPGSSLQKDVGRLTEQALHQVDSIIRLQISRDQDVQRFIKLRRNLDDLLDDGLQQLVEQDSRAAKREAEVTVHRAIYLLAALVMLLLVASGVAAWSLVRTVIQPLRKLADGVASVAGGNLDRRIECKANDEFGEVAKSFNHMTEKLKRSHGDLEQQVASRTEDLAHQATHDPLTGLGNRAGFNLQLANAFKEAHRRGEKLALLLLDLDEFKHINDCLGHAQGDRMLQEVGKRLQGQIREVDAAARLGGDEFCLLLTDVADHRDAAEVAVRCLAALSDPVSLEDQPYVPRASIGIALYPGDAEEPGGLLKAADTAMYAAKRAGKHRYALYEMRMTEAVERQLALEATLREAVARGGFELHYQPQVDLRDGRMRGVEALIRWRHPERGLVPPDEFIPIVEQIGLIDALGEWVLQTACRQAAVWQGTGPHALEVAVNISSGHFQSPGFVACVARVLRDTGLAPHLLEIEVTESMTRNASLHATVSDDLRALGVRVAIDDFGTGYSSLTVLKHMPIHTLKLDRLFIHDMMEDARSSMLIGTIIGIATGLNLAVVAEGVETLDQVRILQGLGCHLAQGYFFSRPVAADSIPGLVDKAFLPDTTGQSAALAASPEEPA